MAAAPELIPEAVTVAEALPVLGVLAACLFAIGCVRMLDAFVRALFGTVSGAVGWIPFAGKVVKAPIHKIEQKVSSALGAAEGYLDDRLGASFHKLGRIGAQLAHDLERWAEFLWTLSNLVMTLPTYVVTHHLIGAALHPLRTLQAIQAKLLRGVTAQVAALRKMVVEGVYPRLRGAEHAIEDVLEPDIAALRSRTKVLEREAADLFDWVRAHPKAVATGAFVGAVAFALRRLGLGWVRCARWKRIGRLGCGPGGALLESLLGLSLALLVVVDPVDIAKAAIKTEDGMHRLVREIAELND